MKIRPVGAELFHADRRTDMTKLTVAFHNTAKAAKNGPYNRSEDYQKSISSDFPNMHNDYL